MLKKIRTLTKNLNEKLTLNKSRAEAFAAVILTAINAKTVLLSASAAALPGTATNKAKFCRMQNFFRECNIDYSLLALLIVHILRFKRKQKMILTIDRTGWQARKNDVNLLVLSVCLDGVAAPLFWLDLRTQGNSKTALRLILLQRFIDTFGKDRIEAITGDREFVGKQWFQTLQRLEIPYIMRIRENFKVAASNGRVTMVKALFRNLRLYQKRCLGEKQIGGTRHHLSAVRLPKNEYVILVSWGVCPSVAAPLYRRRWNIESGFEKLKSHGFNFESSRLRGDGKMELLLAALSLAFALCYRTGEYINTHHEPIMRKSHGRKERSTFGRGLDALMSWCRSVGAKFTQPLGCLIAGIFRRKIPVIPKKS